MLLTVEGPRWLMAAHGSGRRLYPGQLHMFWNLLLDKDTGCGLRPPSRHRHARAAYSQMTAIGCADGVCTINVAVLLRCGRL